MTHRLNPALAGLVAGLLTLTACGDNSKGPPLGMPGTMPRAPESGTEKYDAEQVGALLRENLGDLMEQGRSAKDALGRELTDADVVAMLDTMEALKKGGEEARAALGIKHAGMLMRWPQVAGKFALVKGEMEGNPVPHVPGLTPVVTAAEKAILKRHMDRFVRFTEDD